MVTWLAIISGVVGLLGPLRNRYYLIITKDMKTYLIAVLFIVQNSNSALAYPS